MKRLTRLTLSVLSGPGVLFFVAFSLSTAEYRHFNQFYYGATLIALIANFGFDVAVGRSNPSRAAVLSLIGAHVLLVAALYGLLPWGTGGPAMLMKMAVFAYGLTAGNVLTSAHLLRGDDRTYAIVSVLRASAQACAIPVFLLTHIEFSTLFCATTFISAVVAAVSYKSDSCAGHGLRALYSYATSNFVITSAASFAFTVDKYLANHLLSSEQAAVYTFAWTLVAPMFYIGNVFEKIFVLLAGSALSVRKCLRTLAAMTALLVAFGAATISLPSIWTHLVPKAIDAHMLRGVTTMMVTGYTVFCLIHFPSNGIVFKRTSGRPLKFVSVGQTLIAVAATLGMVFAVRHGLITGYATLLPALFSYLAVLQLPKLAVLGEAALPAWKRMHTSKRGGAAGVVLTPLPLHLESSGILPSPEIQNT